MKKVAVLIGALAFAIAPAFAEEGHQHGDGKHDEHAAKPAASETVTVKGEVVDLACYIGHGAQGEKHAECAKTCIEAGLPVGIKATDGKTYVIIGEHKSLNKQLAAHAAKTITVKGKLASRDGILMISNAEIVK